MFRRLVFAQGVCPLAFTALCATLLLPGNTFAQPSAYNISTIAGNGTAGATGDAGPATSAELSGPTFVALDSSKNLYIADSVNNKIRKITGTTINTVAGNNKQTAGYGGDGGSATASGALMNSPYGVKVDSSGNIFIADLLNHVVREVSGGNISTIAGNNQFGYTGDGGQATQAEFNQPFGLAFDSNRNLYISDSQNNRIRKIDNNGIVTNVAGDGFSQLNDGGPALNAALNDPYGIAVDAAGNLYIADSQNNRVRKVDTSGNITTVAGNGTKGFSGDFGLAINAEINRPFDVAVDSYGDIFIVDSNNNRIREVTPDGAIRTVAGNGIAGYTGDGFIATNARINFPSGIAVDSSTGKIYIGDSGNNVVRLLTPFAPSVNSGGVVSASSFGAFTSIAPGSWIEIYGSSLSFDARSWGGADFNGNNAPTNLDGTTVTIGGQSAFVNYISGGQVNVQVPSNAPTGQQQLVVTTPAGSSSTLNVTVNATQPGLFAPAAFNVGGTQYAGAVLANTTTYTFPPGSVQGITSQRVSAGQTITFYGVGFGSVTPNIPAGQIAQATNTLTAPVTFSIGGAPATVSYQGLAPSFVGLYQFNVVVPSVAASDKVPVTFTQNGTQGTQTMYIAVH